ncbi:MAG TPA: rod-binding protein [Limnochordia bacterium]|nr:rod-binding protein [Limnochordia bacterium]
MRVNWSPGDLVASKAEELGRRQETASQKALREAAEQFEALFVQMLLTEMRRTVPDTDLLGDRRAEKLFQSLLDQELAQNSSQAQSIGLAKLIYEQMSRYLPGDKD